MSISPLPTPPLGRLCTNSGDAVIAENNFEARALALPSEFATHLTELPPDGKPSSVGKEPNTMWGQLWPLRWGVKVVIGSMAINVMRVLWKDRQLQDGHPVEACVCVQDRRQSTRPFLWVFMVWYVC